MTISGKPQVRWCTQAAAHILPVVAPSACAPVGGPAEPACTACVTDRESEHPGLLAASKSNLFVSFFLACRSTRCGRLPLPSLGWAASEPGWAASEGGEAPSRRRPSPWATPCGHAPWPCPSSCHQATARQLARSPTPPPPHPTPTPHMSPHPSTLRGHLLQLGRRHAAPPIDPSDPPKCPSRALLLSTHPVRTSSLPLQQTLTCNGAFACRGQPRGAPHTPLYCVLLPASFSSPLYYT